VFQINVRINIQQEKRINIKNFFFILHEPQNEFEAEKKKKKKIEFNV
jgi:hypothetical protein